MGGSLEPIPLGLHARRGRSAAPATAGLLSALPVRLHSPAATGIHGLTPSVAHLYRNRLFAAVTAGCYVRRTHGRRAGTQRVDRDLVTDRARAHLRLPRRADRDLSLIHISEPTRLGMISY